MISLTKFAVCFVLVLSLSPLTTTPAFGARYEVYSCQEDVRAQLPSQDWSTLTSLSDFRALTDCVSQPIFARTIGTGTTPQGGEHALRFSVPKPLGIVGLNYRSVMHLDSSQYPPGRWWWDFRTRATTVAGRTNFTGGCPGQSRNCRESYARVSTELKEPVSSLDWVFICSQDSPEPCPTGSDNDISIFDGVFGIDDPEIPIIRGQPGGPMFAGVADLTGDQTVVFNATDQGSGIFRATVEVDGRVLGEALLSRDFAACRYPFHVAQPCPRDVVGSATVDTTQLVDGPHEAYLHVYDATNANRATYGPASFTTRNRTVSSFCGSEDRARFRVAVPRQPLAFGTKWRFRARIRDAAGWSATLLDGRRSAIPLGSGIVSVGGRFGVTIPRGPSRVIRLAIRPTGSRDRYVCSPPMRLRVRARIRLWTHPRDAINGQSVALGGRLYGRGKARKAVVIQARALGSARWATVRVVRTDRKGRYRMRYRFRSSRAGITYVFRSQSRAEEGYPYATGTSKRRLIRIIGA